LHVTVSAMMKAPSSGRALETMEGLQNVTGFFSQGGKP
jgi:hypothetical protein